MPIRPESCTAKKVSTHFQVQPWPGEPLDLLARLAALVPLPRVHLTRFHGLFAPHSHRRAAITPARRGGAAHPPPPQPHAMRWMQRLKRAFRIDLETCQRCGGTLRVIARIEDPALIRLILEHLDSRNPAEALPRSLAHRR